MYKITDYGTKKNVSVEEAVPIVSDKKVLSDCEALIISNMLISSMGPIATYGGYKKLETHKDLSKEELKTLIGKMDDYNNECILEQIKNGNCDEAFLLVNEGIKNTLITEYKNRK